MEFYRNLLDMGHLREAVGENFRHVQGWHVKTYETEASDVLIVNTSFAAQFENLRAVDWVSELEFLHVDFYAYLGQIVLFLLQL